MNRFFFFLPACCVIACSGPSGSPVPQTELTKAVPAVSAVAESEPIEPLPEKIPVDGRKAKLGHRLFHDPILSKDGTVSCASCHAMDKGGTDLAPVSTGVGGALGGINSPTVFNAAFNLAQFWDGRAKDLVEQAQGPVENPKEMAESWDNVVSKLKADESYADSFALIYPDGVTRLNAADAIAEFEKTLITPNSRFDRYLKGDKAALNQDEIAGYELFKGKGCATCHNGANVGGNSYQKLGVMADYFADRGMPVTEADLGRYNFTKDELDKHFFKVPSLRLAALTPPYFHDASRKTLAEAIQAMGKYQLGLDLSPEEISKIEAFLRSLPGDYEGQPLIK